MPSSVEIEDIEEKRRQEGIDDEELRVEIRGLKVGDLVRLTFLMRAGAFETLPVRITSIRGSAFRGKLGGKPPTGVLRKLAAGAVIAFTTAHIHSLLRKQ